MVKSDFCILNNMSTEDKVKAGECEYDEGILNEYTFKSHSFCPVLK